MREKILNAIRKNEIETYLITETVTEGAELYFIKKELDMRRMKKEASAGGCCKENVSAISGWKKGGGRWKNRI